MCMCWSGVCVCLQEFISVCTGWFICQWSCVCLIHPLFANLIFHPEELSYYLYYRGEMGYFLTSGKYNLLVFLIYLLFCFLIKKKRKKNNNITKNNMIHINVTCDVQLFNKYYFEHESFCNFSLE